MKENFTKKEIDMIIKQIQEADNAIIITDKNIAGCGTEAGVLAGIVNFLAAEYNEKEINDVFLDFLPILVRKTSKLKNVDKYKKRYKEEKEDKEINEMKDIKDILKECTELLDRIEKL